MEGGLVRRGGVAVDGSLSGLEVTFEATFSASAPQKTIDCSREDSLRLLSRLAQ